MLELTGEKKGVNEQFKDGMRFAGGDTLNSNSEQF